MSYNDPELRGVGGWLAFLIVILALFNPVQLLFAVGSVLSDTSLQAAYGAAWPTIQAAEIVIACLALLLTWFLAWRLNSVHTWQTIRIVVPGLWILAFGVLLAEFVAVSVIGNIPFTMLMNQGLAEFIRPAAFCIVWTAYLLRSVRVANTYERYPGSGHVDAEVFS